VPLSEHEKRLLAEIEHALSAESPRLDAQLRSSRAGGWRRAVAGLAWLRGVLSGVALMVVGSYDAGTAGTVVALLGYCLIVVSLVAMIARRQKRRRDGH
jgi:hypothetical protein